MTTLDSSSVRCRNCGTMSEHSVVLSTSSFGSPDLDLRPPEMQRSTMDTWLQLCPGCGYCAPDIGQPPADPAVLQSEVYRVALQRPDVPGLARRFLAFAVAGGPSDPATAGHAYLRAAWVCDDTGQAEAAADSRRLAAEWFRRCKPFAEDDQGVAAAAVLVDVLRRSGQFAEASAECASVLAGRAATGVVRKVLEHQQRLITLKDSGAHAVSDCDGPAT